MTVLTKSNIALLVDYENVAKPARENLDAILAQAEREGTVVLRRAYANWGRFESHKNQMRSAGFEMIDVASVHGKNSVDIKLVVDAMEIAYSKNHIDTFVIASGDSDFIPLVVKLNELDRRAWLHIPHAQVSPALEKFCFRMPGSVSSCSGKTVKIGPTIPNNSPVASGAIAKTKSEPKHNILSVVLTSSQLASIRTAIQTCDLMFQSPLPLDWLVCAIRALEPHFDQAGCLGSGKRPFVRLGKHLYQRGDIDFALDQQRKAYLFSCKTKLSLTRAQACNHPNFRAAVEILKVKAKHARGSRIVLRTDFDLSAYSLNMVASAKAIDNVHDARPVGPSLADADQQVVADELDETPVQLMFSF